MILDITSKKESIALPSIAKDYVYLIPAEMWFGLIIERLNGNYYRSFSQVQADLDLILTNCENYNGLDNELSTLAKKLIQEIKRNLKGIDATKVKPPPQAEKNQSSSHTSNQMNVSDTKISIPMALLQRP